MMCPLCQSKRSKIRFTNPRTGGQLQRLRTCEDCGLFYKTVEIGVEVFAKIKELMAARRDLDAQILDALCWQGQVYEQTGKTCIGKPRTKTRRAVAVDAEASSAG